MFVLFSERRLEVQACNPPFGEDTLLALSTIASGETREQFEIWKREGKAQDFAVNRVQSEQWLSKEQNALIADMLGSVLSLDNNRRYLSEEKLKSFSLRVKYVSSFLPYDAQMNSQEAV